MHIFKIHHYGKGERSIMGRTLLPFRMALEEELSTWKRFRSALSPENQILFDELMQYAREHADAGSLAGRSLLSEVIFMSIAIEQQKKLHFLQKQLEDMKEKLTEQLGKGRIDDN